MRSEPPTNGVSHPGLSAAERSGGAIAHPGTLGQNALATRNRGLELRQIAGLHAGGRVELPIGSYRFGPKSGATALGGGRVEGGVFGLTVDPEAEVMLIIGAEPVQLDGEVVAESRPIVPGQIITAAGSRFELAATTTSSDYGAASPDQAAPSNPPTSAKGRKVDPDAVAWADTQRRQADAALRAATATPFEVSHRSKIGPSAFFLDTPASPGFGQVPIGFTERPYTFSGDLSSLNGPTRKHLQKIELMPSAPIIVDLLNESIAIVGTRNTARTVATWIALSVAVTSHPDAAAIRLCARGQRGDWSWIDALPHPDELPASPLNLVVFDETDVPAEVPARGTVVVVEHGQNVPAGVAMTLQLAKNGPTYTRSGQPSTDVTPIGVSSMFALETVFQINDHFHTTGVVR